MKHEIDLSTLSADDSDTLNCAAQRFRMDCRLSENQSGTFTTSHRRWDCRLYMDGEFIFETDFQCNMENEPNCLDVWRCVTEDAMSYHENTDVADFLEEYGYCGNSDSIRDGMKAYRGCKRAWDSLSENGISPQDANLLLQTMEESGLNFAELAETNLLY